MIHGFELRCEQLIQVPRVLDVCNISCAGLQARRHDGLCSHNNHLVCMGEIPLVSRKDYLLPILPGKHCFKALRRRSRQARLKRTGDASIYMCVGWKIAGSITIVG